MNLFKTLPVLLSLSLASGLAAAATFVANTSIDLPDNNPGDGLCRSDGLPPSMCTLRAAIMEANALAGLHFVELQPGRTYTLTRAGQDDVASVGDLDITKSLIVGCVGCADNPPIVDGNGLDRVFDIHGGTTILRGFDITGGYPIDADGGAIKARAGATELQLLDMRLYANQAFNADGRGGAIYSQAGTGVQVQGSEIYFNSSMDQGSAIFVESGGPVSLMESVVHSNGPIPGVFTPVAAVRVIGSGISLRNTTISGNVGNGLALVNTSDAVSLRNSTVAGNLGGLIIGHAAANTVRIRNSIIARNGMDCAFVLTTPDVEGYNVFSDLTCDQGTPGSTNLVDHDPLLTPLKRRQGEPSSMPLHWPRIDSAALSSGALEQTPDIRCEDMDQIGTPRPQGFNGIEHCDRGAAEVPDDAIFFDSLETL